MIDVGLCAGLARNAGRLALSGILLACGAAAPALEAPERWWSHGDWQAEFQAGTCEIRTGGDGAGVFRIQFQMGGFDGDATYLPVVYSNMPAPLTADDEFDLIIDQRVTDFGSELWFHDGNDPFGRYMVGASLTGGFVPDLVAEFRRGNRAALRISSPGAHPYIAEDFSLAGFSAAYLKISEWCHFDPDNLFQS